MSAFLMIQGTISNQERWQQYRSAVVPLIERFGGKHISKPGQVEVLEGTRRGWIVVLFESPSMDSLHLFWESPEYVPIKQLRQDAADLDIVAVERA